MVVPRAYSADTAPKTSASAVMPDCASRCDFMVVPAEQAVAVKAHGTLQEEI